MVWRFSFRSGSVMTISAGSRVYVTVVEHGRSPRIGAMAIITGIATGDVSGRFSGGNVAIVAACASSQYRSMIDPIRG
jgi:hypothetical protein